MINKGICRLKDTDFIFFTPGSIRPAPWRKAYARATTFHHQIKRMAAAKCTDYSFYSGPVGLYQLIPFYSGR